MPIQRRSRPDQQRRVCAPGTEHYESIAALLRAHAARTEHDRLLRSIIRRLTEGVDVEEDLADCLTYISDSPRPSLEFFKQHLKHTWSNVKQLLPTTRVSRLVCHTHAGVLVPMVDAAKVARLPLELPDSVPESEETLTQAELWRFLGLVSRLREIPQHRRNVQWAFYPHYREVQFGPLVFSSRPFDEICVDRSAFERFMTKEAVDRLWSCLPTPRRRGLVIWMQLGEHPLLGWHEGKGTVFDAFQKCMFAFEPRRRRNQLS